LGSNRETDHAAPIRYDIRLAKPCASSAFGSLLANVPRLFSDAFFGGSDTFFGGSDTFFGGSDAFFGGPDILEMPEHPLTTTLSPLSLRRSWRPAPRSLAFPLFLALLLGWTGPGALWAQDGPLDPREMELRPGDVIRIQVWRQPELSGEFFITADGRIGHPLYRSIFAVARPLREVQESLRLFLLEFEAEPNFVLEAFFQVAVGGQVRQPNVHALRPGTTVAEAVARAGGVTEQGRLDRVILRRDGREYRVDLTDAAGAMRLTTIRSGDEIVVLERRSRFRNYVLPVISVAGSVASIIRVIQYYR
jgi:protein involved in polysaccharide export with SLBB domain